MTGIICLRKPEGVTSFQAVRKVRGITGEKKAGHCGTLDPEATGVLPVMLGGATRFLEFLPTTPKQYRAVMKLGVVTDTLDLTGTVLETRDVSAGREEILSALGRFRGDILQVPPMYSALKKDGVRLYDLARQGVEVEREARPVTIFELELLPDGTDGTDP
ncbi:MAG: tRNA pseudouridine(55) synthase TruB [Clostridia bacterium]|nr:tRNA pseudouridine(55) synthase TruB [Clostridia bacterium]